MLIKTYGRFVGDAKLDFPQKEARKVILCNDFAFIDSSGFEWFAPRDSIVDGSSIPFFLWPLIGSPFVGLHRLASITHDVYCVTQSEPHKKVHQMYEDACRCNGVSKFKANLLHTGIKLGGPTWSIQ